MKYIASILFVKKSLGKIRRFSEAQLIIIEFPLKQPKRTRRLFPIVLLHSGKNKSSQHRGKEDKAVLAAV
jgi:hypothetical protein